MGKTQLTANSAIVAWNWIHNNAHHEVGTKYAPGGEIRTHMHLKGHGFTLWIPEELVPEVWAGIKPNKRKFDTRMYALRAKAKRAIGVS